VVEWDDVDWIGLADVRDRWRALANSVLNLLVYTCLFRSTRYDLSITESVITVL
jgi:hypothetical protein